MNHTVRKGQEVLSHELEDKKRGEVVDDREQPGIKILASD